MDDLKTICLKTLQNNFTLENLEVLAACNFEKVYSKIICDDNVNCILISVDKDFPIFIRGFDRNDCIFQFLRDRNNIEKIVKTRYQGKYKIIDDDVVEVQFVKGDNFCGCELQSINLPSHKHDDMWQSCDSKKHLIHFNTDYTYYRESRKKLYELLKEYNEKHDKIKSERERLETVLAVDGWYKKVTVEQEKIKEYEDLEKKKTDLYKILASHIQQSGTELDEYELRNYSNRELMPSIMFQKFNHILTNDKRFHIFSLENNHCD
jgi:hypothetical protein